MTIEEIKEKYGNVELKFVDYYKYSFGFKGLTDDGEEVYVSAGGDADEIYRMNISVDSVETINSLEPHYIQISKNGNIIVTGSMS